jgi:hypothetical protein
MCVLLSMSMSSRVWSQYGINVNGWIRNAEAQVCKSSEQCKQYLALSPKGRATVLQHILRRKGAGMGISEIEIVNWVMKCYDEGS